MANQPRGALFHVALWCARLLLLALASASVDARPPPRPLYPERAARPLYPEPVRACKPLFIPLCRVLYAAGVRP